MGLIGGVKSCGAGCKEMGLTRVLSDDESVSELELTTKGSKRLTLDLRLLRMEAERECLWVRQDGMESSACEETGCSGEG